MRRNTLALHAGYETPDSNAKAVAVPIYQTVAYAFDSADHAEKLFDLDPEAKGFRYTRIANPTTSVLEERVNALEHGVGALCVASGQAALDYAFACLTVKDSNIVSVPQLYGTTHTLFTEWLPMRGVTVRFAASDSADDITKLIDDGTRAVFAESVGNPAGNVCDVGSLAQVAHSYGVPFVVDNTVATPMLLNPIDHGADIVVHSLTKYIGGHGTSLGGAVVDGGRFPWTKFAHKFPMFTQPDTGYHGLVYTERFGAAAYIARCRSFCQRINGAVLSPFNAFLILQGIETLGLRMKAHVENGRLVANHLRQHPKIEFVRYAGFDDSPYHKLVQKYLHGCAPSLITFGLHGGYESGKRFLDALRIVKRLVNLGDAKSLACHPASTTHRQMPPDAQRKAGITPSTIRMSVGIEDVEDIIADLDHALAEA